jgi:hypothetical protein
LEAADEARRADTCIGGQWRIGEGRRGGGPRVSGGFFRCKKLLTAGAGGVEETAASLVAVVVRWALSAAILFGL